MKYAGNRDTGTSHLNVEFVFLILDVRRVGDEGGTAMIGMKGN
jgi:hypothetical protein